MSELRASRREIGVAIVRCCAVQQLFWVSYDVLPIARLEHIQAILSAGSYTVSEPTAHLACDLAWLALLWFLAEPCGAFLMDRLRKRQTGLVVGCSLLVLSSSTATGLQLLTKIIVVKELAKYMEGFRVVGIATASRHYASNTAALLLVAGIPLVGLIVWNRWTNVEAEA